MLYLAASQYAPSTPSPASSSRGGEARQRSFSDEIPLKLCQRAEDLEHELPAARTGIQLLLQTSEVHTTPRFCRFCTVSMRLAASRARSDIDA
jgi:hypothetical protein